MPAPFSISKKKAMPILFNDSFILFSGNVIHNNDENSTSQIIIIELPSMLCLLSMCVVTFVIHSIYG